MTPSGVHMMLIEFWGIVPACALDTGVCLNTSAVAVCQCTVASFSRRLFFHLLLRLNAVAGMQRVIAPTLSWRESWVGIGWDLCATPRATVTWSVFLLVAVGAIVERRVIPLLTFHSASEY